MYAGSSEVASGSSGYVLAKGQHGTLTSSEAKVINKKKIRRTKIYFVGMDAEGKIISRPTGLVGLFQDGHICHEK